ncbi:MAG: dUTP diphosphatase [Bacilli bacterium]|nr:dUTP diphosphatase [Bacilli bacterium]MBQ6283010.1 dUTP diphosphatase [Bacilli bacterium]
MKKRGFEVAKGWEDKNINLPVRKTARSAGYDVEAAEDIIIPVFENGCKPTLVHTGLKAYCQDDEWYMLANRSSNPGKKKLVLANGIGIIDADYYGNPDNDGEFMYAYYNIGNEPIEIKKGDVIGQVVFQKFLVTDDDNATGNRTGGFGSTDKRR